MAKRTAVHVTKSGRENEIYFFKDREYLRLNVATGKDVSGSHYITTYWKSLKHLGWDTVDAWLPIPNSSYAYGFRGDDFVKHNLNNEDIPVGPSSWAAEWPALAQAGFTKIDAALPWSAYGSKSAWFFSGERCTLLNVETGSIEKVVDDISVHWPILKTIRFDTIEMAILKPSEETKVWFFSGDLYAEIDLKALTNNTKGALIVKDQWPGLAIYY